MQYSQALKTASRKYYDYCRKHDKSKTVIGRFFFEAKREKWRLETSRLFRQEYPYAAV